MRLFRKFHPATVAAIAAVLAVAFGLLSPSRLNAQSNDSATYTAKQATAGRTAYSQSCASCHGPHIDDGEFAPLLKGAAFFSEVWRQAGQ